MTIYKLKSDIVNYLSFTIDPVEFMLKMGDEYSSHFMGESKREGWNEPDGKFFKTNDHKKGTYAIPDITMWSLGNIVMNDKAYSLLSGELGSLGEFLPVKCEGKQYHIFNNTNVVEDSAVDADNSTQIIEKGLFMGLESLAFIEDRVSDQLVFKTKYDNCAFSYCTDRFRELVESNGLTGLYFETELARL